MALRRLDDEDSRFATPVAARMEEEWAQRRRRYHEGSRLDKFFDVLGTTAYTVGGVGLTIREGAQETKGKDRLAFIMDRTNWQRNIAFSTKHGVEMSDVLEIKSFWAGLATNIVTDPLSALPSGALSKGAKIGGSTLYKMLPSVAQRGVVAVGGKVGSATRGARDFAGEVFSPGYKLKKLGGKTKEFYEGYSEMLMNRRGAVSQALFEIKEMGKPFKRSGELVTEYIEKGKSTGVEGLDKYVDDVVRPYLGSMLEKEQTMGYGVRELANYVPHVLTDKGKKLIAEYGDEERVIKFLRDKAQMKYGIERKMTGGISEINEILGTEYFVKDAWQAISVRAQRSAKDRATSKWLKNVEQTYGLQKEAKTVREALTAGAMKAQGQLGKAKSLERSFRQAVTDIGRGDAPGLFIGTAVDKAAKGILKGRVEKVRSITREMTQYSEILGSAQRRVRGLESDITMDTSVLVSELTPKLTGARKISRAAAENLDRRIEETIARLPGASTGVDLAQAKLRGMTMEIQREILDPVARKISGLETKASQTKNVRTAQTAVNDAMDYVATTHPQVTAQLPKDMARFLDDLVETTGVDTPVKQVGRAHDYVLNKWKKSVTLGLGALVHTAFFTRNVTTGMLQNAQQIGLVKTASGFVDYLRLSANRGTFNTFEKGAVDADTMKRMMRESGIMESTGMSDVKIAQKMYPTTFEKVMGVGGSLMSWSEDLVRRPLFLAQSKTMSQKEVAKEVAATHFDYSPEALTATERGIKRVVMPFYTWTRFNIARQTKQLFGDPKGIDIYGKIQRTSVKSAGLEEQYEGRAEWNENRFMIANPLNETQLMSVAIPPLDLMADVDSMYFGITPFKAIAAIGDARTGWGTDEYKKEKIKSEIEDLVLARYASTFKRWTSSDKTTADKLMTEMGTPVYNAREAPISFDEFEQYRYRTYQPTKEQEYAAWVLAGQPEAFKIVQLGEARTGMGVESDKIIKAPMWKFWQKDEVIKAPKPEFDLVAVSAEVQAMGKGYPWTEAELAKLTGYTGADRSAAYTKVVTDWSVWKAAQYSLEPTTTQQKMAAWERSGRPDNATARVYRGEAGKLLGVASWQQDEIEKLNTYAEKNIRLTNAAYEWAFIQSDMPPEEYILSQLDKENLKYLNVNAAKEELRGFEVDQPIPASEVNMTQQIEYGAYRQDRVDHEQKLLEKALGRGETI